MEGNQCNVLTGSQPKNCVYVCVYTHVHAYKMTQMQALCKTVNFQVAKMVANLYTQHINTKRNIR